MKVNEFRQGLWRRPDMQDKVVLIEAGDVTHAVHRAVVSNGHVVLVAGSVVSPLEPDLKMTDHPWQVYLHHRARALRWLAEQGNDPELTARQMTMDPGQVRLILGYVHDYPEDFADPVAPVPVPMARRVARERASVLPGGDK